MLSQVAFFLRETQNKMFTPDFQAALFNTMKVDTVVTFPSLNVVLGNFFSTQERKSYRYTTMAFVCVCELFL